MLGWLAVPFSHFVQEWLLLLLNGAILLKRHSSLKFQVRSQVEKIKKEITAEKFVDQTPIYFKGTQTEIPHWKRLLMAQKIAAEAIRQREDALWVRYSKLTLHDWW